MVTLRVAMPPMFLVLRGAFNGTRRADARSLTMRGSAFRGSPCLQEVLSGVSAAETPRGGSAGRQLASGGRPWAQQGVRA